MCGRYASARKRIELLEEFDVERDRVDESLEADYNVAPTKPVYAVLTRTRKTGQQAGSKQTGGEQASGEQAGQDTEHDALDGGPGQAQTARELRVVRWGLVPVWAKDPSIGSRMINARAETVDSKPAYRRAFARRRCLLPADGYYEWQPVTQGQKTRKQPYFITRKDGRSLAMAGIYELWRDRELPEDHERAWMWTASIITTDAPDELGQIHDRMPMIIEPEHWADWLDPGSEDPAGLRSLLAPATAGGLEWHPVSTAVNSVRHNGPELIDEIKLDGTENGAANGGAANGGAGNGGAATGGLSGADER